MGLGSAVSTDNLLRQDGVGETPHSVAFDGGRALLLCQEQAVPFGRKVRQPQTPNTPEQPTERRTHTLLSVLMSSYEFM